MSNRKSQRTGRTTGRRSVVHRLCGAPGLAVPTTAVAADGVPAAMPVVLGVFAVLLLAALWALYRARHARALAETRIAELELRLEDRDRALQDAAARLDELHGLLKDMSLRDGLTGLYNRRCLDQVLVEAWKTTVAQRDPLSLLMIDIDHFKQLNDKYGHGAGDDCLREVAQRLQRHATTLGGVVARYGGEEFVVVLAHTGTDIAQALAEALRNAVAGTPVKTSAAPLWVTISLGVATARPDGRDSLGAVLKRADEALYRAKREGRNRVAAG